MKATLICLAASYERSQFVLGFTWPRTKPKRAPLNSYLNTVHHMSHKVANPRASRNFPADTEVCQSPSSSLDGTIRKDYCGIGSQPESSRISAYFQIK